LECAFVLSLKNTDCRRQKKLNTEDILKNHDFYGVRSFPEAAKLCGNNILKKKGENLVFSLKN